MKGKNLALDMQDKRNTNPARPAKVTVEKEGEAAAPAELTVEKEAKAATPPTVEAAPFLTEVIDKTKRTKGNG